MMRPQGHGAQLLLPGGCQNKQFLVLFVFPSESPRGAISLFCICIN